MRCKYYNPKMHALKEYCKCLYKLPNCGAGGMLHILLDDNNYSDSDLAWLRGYCEEHKDSIEYEIAIVILDMYSKMSLKERAFFDSMWCGQDVSCKDSRLCETCDLIEVPWFIEEKQNE